MLKFPDFEPQKETYQLMSQVGRSGRKGKGKVVIQTYDENHEIIQLVKNHKYKLMSQKQLEESYLNILHIVDLS